MKKYKTPRPMLPVVLGCLFFLGSCGGGGSSQSEPPHNAPYTALYPALAAHAAMDEEDFERYVLTARRGTDITPESIKSLSVGSSIDTAASTYNLRPIFDLGRLKEDNRLDVDTTGSQEKTVLRITSNKKASSASSQTTVDTSFSGSGAGFKGAAAFHYADAQQSTKSDGTVSVQMASANTNNVASILSSGFTGGDNFTPYLIGSKLSDEQLHSYISITQGAANASCGGKAPITGVAIKRYKLADTEPYANIQILTRMQEIFADLRLQHELCLDAGLQKQTVLNMIALRSKIESAIADFYAFNGDAFVSKTTSMNQAIGKGTLSFSQADGNAESQYGASLSVGYETLTAGVGGSAAVQYYKQNGWATALQNVQVAAEAQPAGVADTTAWVASLHTMLKDQAKSEVPPMGSLPKNPGVNLPEPLGPKHPEVEGPPDTAFTSYDQWKKYQEDKKAQKDAEALEKAKKRVEQEPLVVNEDRVLLQGRQDSNAYLQLIAELDALKLRASPPPSMPQASSSNLVRFDKMYVNGFEMLPYDAVIPQLRPDLDIPGKTTAISSFPQLMELMLVTEKLGRLDAYLGFLANLPVSNVTPQMSDRYHQFFLKASARAYDLITLSLSQGADIEPEILAGYKKAMLGTTATKAKEQSELYKSLQDMDYYAYVVDTLLDPMKGKAWAVAPGGYLPMRWKQDGFGGAELVTWTALSQERGGHRGKEGVVAIDFSNPNADPLTLFRNGMKAIQTPWYPVYIFNQNKTPALVFVQHFGAYQAIYGARWVVRPFDGDTPVVPSLKPKWVDYQALGSRDMRRVMTETEEQGKDNSFLGNMSWDYSLYFPNSSNDPARLQKFNALLIQLPGDHTVGIGESMYSAAHSAAVRDMNSKLYKTTAASDATYPAFRESVVVGHWMRRISDGERVDTTKRWNNDYNYDAMSAFMLLPLNANTTGESLKQAFNYAPERQPNDIVGASSLDLINKMAVILQ